MIPILPPVHPEIGVDDPSSDEHLYERPAQAIEDDPTAFTKLWFGHAAGSHPSVFNSATQPICWLMALGSHSPSATNLPRV